MSDNQVENMIIIGGGPAGYTAALYAARAELISEFSGSLHKLFMSMFK